MVLLMGYHTLDDNGDDDGDVDDDGDINERMGLERLFLVRYPIHWLGVNRLVDHEFCSGCLTPLQPESPFWGQNYLDLV